MKYLFILILKFDEYFEIFRRDITKIVKSIVILKIFFKVAKEAIALIHNDLLTELSVKISKLATKSIAAYGSLAKFSSKLCCYNVFSRIAMDVFYIQCLSV